MDHLMRKVTITISSELLEFADCQARRFGRNRSQYINQVLADVHRVEKEQLAAEGYQRYAEESSSFAEGNIEAFSEVLNER